MTCDLIVALFFFFFTVVAFLLTSPYLLDTIGTAHNWTELLLLTLLNDDLPILLIRKRDCNGNINHPLIATWDTNSYNNNDLFLWVTSYETASVKRTS